MRSRTAATVAATMLVASLLVNGVVAAPASASHACAGGTVDIFGNITAVACSHETTPGEPGGPSGNPNGGTVTVSSPPPDCRFFPDKTGAEMAALIGFIGPVMPPFPPAAQMQAYATDLDGRWYRPDCLWSAGTAGTPDALDRRRAEFQIQNGYVWSRTAPTPPPVPVVDLIQVAKDSQSVPTPVVELNPAGQTVTGLRTWVWPTGGGLQPVVSRAESGPNWAQVTATPGRLVLAAPAAAEVGPCTSPQVWSAGRPDDATDCYVLFRQSSAGAPGGKVQLSVGVEWTVTLTTSDGIDNGVIGTITRAAQIPVAVAQVQSVLR